MTHKMTIDTMSHSDDKIKKKHKKKLINVEIICLDRKKGGKMQRGDSRSKKDLKPPLLDK